jgi:hypothetical protein
LDATLLASPIYYNNGGNYVNFSKLNICTPQGKNWATHSPSRLGTIWYLTICMNHQLSCLEHDVHISSVRWHLVKYYGLCFLVSMPTLCLKFFIITLVVISMFVGGLQKTVV